MGLFDKLKSKMKDMLDDENQDVSGSPADTIKSLKSQFSQQKKILVDSFDQQDRQLKDSLGVFGIKWETRVEKEERKKKEELELQRRIEEAKEQARLRAIEQQRIEDLKYNPENHREELIERSYTQHLFPDLTIRKIQENFNEEYVYLRIGFYLVKTGASADKDGGTIYSLNSDTELRSVKSYRGNCDVVISGKDTPDSLEKKFRSQSGLVIKIEYNDENDNRFYISKDSNWHKTPLCDINIQCKKNGYKFADIS